MTSLRALVTTAVLVFSGTALAGWTKTGDSVASFLGKGPAGFKIEGKTKSVDVKDDGKALTVVVSLKDLETGIDLRGAETVVVGHSEIVGKPIAVLLLHRLSTVTVCHVGTRRLVDHTRRADILVVAVGKAGLVHGDMIKPGACVIDVGINQGPDGKIVGDVDFASAADVAGWITPVPGGVGPVTVAMLMRNTLRAAGATV
jgi:5,10-methylene-tetrahydrofolate dehydrogenase/methenyl tetrahydrofolate cyclohydrolase